jgi:hypothetical protein
MTARAALLLATPPEKITGRDYSQPIRRVRLIEEGVGPGSATGRYAATRRCRT